MNETLPPGWENTLLSKVFDRFQYGLTAKAKPSSEGVRFLRITDLNGNNINWQQVPTCELTEADIQKYRLLDGDFVFARSGSVEKACRIDNPPNSVFASYLIRAHPINRDISDWLKWFIVSPLYLQQIYVLAAGIGLQNVNAKKFASIELPLPPIQEQKRIAAKLDAIMAKVQNIQTYLENIPDLLKRTRNSILSTAMSGRLTEEWRLITELQQRLTKKQ